MIRSLTAFTFLLLAFQVFSQNVEELERRNGFKDLKLTMPVDSINGLVFKKDFKEKEEFEAKLYEVENEEYKRIGEVQVQKIEVRSYKGLVYQISVFADKDPRLMKALESIYGKAEYDMKQETYFWKASTLILSFKAAPKKLLLMEYTSFKINRMMKEDKAKKVEAIADDF